MKQDTNRAILVLLGALGILADTLSIAIQNGSLPLPVESAWIGVVLGPVLIYVARQMPKPGTEDVLDLASKIGYTEAAKVLRKYLHKVTGGEDERRAIRRANSEGT